MSEMNHPQALGSTRLGFADEGELDRFVEKLEAFERGELAPDTWRAFRLVHGVYGQRQDGPMMVRCKIPQGVLTPEQLLALAEVSERWSNGRKATRSACSASWRWNFVRRRSAVERLPSSTQRSGGVRRTFPCPR